jgi:hypothetical protein
MAVFGVLFALAVFLSLAQYFQWSIFNPFAALMTLFK